MEVGTWPLVTCIRYTWGWIYPLQTPDTFQRSASNSWEEHILDKQPRVTLLNMSARYTTLSVGASSCWWWVSFLWRTSECFSRWEWGVQLTVSLMDSAAAKRLDSADTHWPRESSKRVMTTQYSSSELGLLHTGVCSLLLSQTVRRGKTFKSKFFRKDGR